MTLTEIAQNVQFVVDTEGRKKAAQIDLPVWEALMAFLKDYEDDDEYDATEELLAMPGLIEAIEQSKQRVHAGQFTRYQEIKRDV